MNVIWEELKRAADARQRDVLMRFFKTGPGQYGAGDKFLGVKVPVTRALVKAHGLACTDAEVDELVTSPYHEARLAGLLVLCRQYAAARDDAAAQTQIVARYLGYTAYINNWDLVDLTAYVLLGDWFLSRDRAPLIALARHPRSIWEARIAIVATWQFIRHGDFETTLGIAQILLHHPHDLIQKAVGWMLREVGKRDRAVLEHFLRPRVKTMPRTMLRYAIERFPESLRQKYLHGTIRHKI